MSRPLLRTWQALLLALSLLATPQLALVHALTHVASAKATSNVDDRQGLSDKVCDACLALSQLGTALPSHFDWQAQTDILPSFDALPQHGRDVQAPLAFDARGPPPRLG